MTFSVSFCLFHWRLAAGLLFFSAIKTPPERHSGIITASCVEHLRVEINTNSSITEATWPLGDRTDPATVLGRFRCLVLMKWFPALLSFRSPLFKGSLSTCLSLAIKYPVRQSRFFLMTAADFWAVVRNESGESLERTVK